MNKSLTSRFAAVVGQYGQKTALVFENARTVSYAELDRTSNRVARYLQEQGLQKSGVVGIHFEKSLTSYSLILACIKIGAVYFVTDPKNPVARLKNIFATCNPDLIFSKTELAGIVPEKTKVVLSHENAEFADSFSDSELKLPYSVLGSDPAYIMFTSGSTGSPKGAVISQGNLNYFIDWAVSEYQFNSSDVHTHINPLYFDNSVFDMYSTFFSGGALVPFLTDELQNPEGIIKKIEDTKCTAFFSVPSMLIFLQATKVIRADSMPSMKKIIFGGEGYPKAKLLELYDLLNSRTEFHNVYGPTECTCICSTYKITRADFQELDGYPPIGSLTANFSYVLLTEENKKAKEGETGELCLGGPCVGLGYYNQPELTEKAFVQNPLNTTFEERLYRTGDLMRLNPKDGKLWFVGRKDYQIKHQGYRIELEEIQHAFCMLDGVVEAAALHFSSNNMSKIWCVVSSNQILDPAMLKKQVAQLLPKYMIPSKIIVMDRLPKNANGKTDRGKLKELFITSNEDQK